MAVEAFAKANDFSDFEDAPKFKGLLSQGAVGGEKVFLLKPMTYMNLSGDAVAPFTTFYKLDPKADVLAVSDDIDMDFGKVRFREKGSSGGQNGLKSIANRLGTEEFARVKIGIGRDRRFEAADWVLSKFKPEELEELEKGALIEAGEKIGEWIRGA